MSSKGERLHAPSSTRDGRSLWCNSGVHSATLIPFGGIVSRESHLSWGRIHSLAITFACRFSTRGVWIALWGEPGLTFYSQSTRNVSQCQKLTKGILLLNSTIGICSWLRVQGSKTSKTRVHKIKHLEKFHIPYNRDFEIMNKIVSLVKKADHCTCKAHLYKTVLAEKIHKKSRTNLNLQTTAFHNGWHIVPSTVWVWHLRRTARHENSPSF